MHVASNLIQSIKLALVSCRLECIHMVNNFLQVEPSTIPEQVISILGVLVGVWNEEDVINSMPDHMIPSNLLVGFDHHRFIGPLFTHSIKVGVSNLIAEIIFYFNSLF